MQAQPAERGFDVENDSAAVRPIAGSEQSAFAGLSPVARPDRTPANLACVAGQSTYRQSVSVRSKTGRPVSIGTLLSTAPISGPEVVAETCTGTRARLFVLRAAAGFARTPGHPAHRPRHIYRGVPTFQTTPDLRVPAFVLVPKHVPLPAPGLVVLHCHGGAYVWGKEKVVAVEHEHPALSDFKNRLYEGTSVATELVRRGYVVISIDMFYWGERRMLLDSDPASYRDSSRMAPEEIDAFNRRSSQNEQLVARTLMTAGITWPGVVCGTICGRLTISPAARMSITSGLAASAFQSAAIAVSFSPPSTSASRRRSTSAG